MIPYRYTTLFIVFLFICCDPLFSQSEIGSNDTIFIKQNSKVIKVEDLKITQVSGYMSVPENRNNPNSKSIRILVTIYKSTNPSPHPPVFRLAGKAPANLIFLKKSPMLNC